MTSQYPTHTRRPRKADSSVTTAYDRVEDVEGILSCLDKKAALFRYRGEEGLAEEMDGMYDAEIAEVRRREDEARGVGL